MRSIVKTFGRADMRGLKKRVLAAALALLMIFNMAPMVWLSAGAAGEGYICGLEEHIHSAECYAAQPVCGLEEGEQYEAHAHGEACFSSVLTCGLEEGGEHTHAPECFTAELICGLDEGAGVSAGTHTHADGCYALVCGADEHAHSDGCAAPVVEVAPEETTGESPSRAVGSELLITGVWDTGDAQQGHENIAFGSGKTATIEHDDKLVSENITVRITAAFPDNASQKSFSVTLRPGLMWVHNGASSIPASNLSTDVGAVENETVVYGTALGDGTYTYELTDGVEQVVIDIIVKKNIAVNFASIENAIAAEASCVMNGEDKATTAGAVLERVEPEQFSYVGVTSSKLSMVTKPSKDRNEPIFIVGSPIVMHTYVSATSTHNKRLYDYAEVTVVAPSDIELLTAAKAHGTEGLANVAMPGWTVRSSTVEGDQTVYVLRRDNFLFEYLGVTPEWYIPSDKYSGGETIVVTVKDLRWKLYGDDEVYTSSKSGTLTYNIVDPNERNEMVQSVNFNQTMSYIPSSPDAVYQLAAWSLRNDGADPSAPKTVEFDFDSEKIGVTSITMLIPKGETVTKVYYKLDDADEWQGVDVSIKADGSAALNAKLIDILDLGLGEDDYLAAFKYDLDFTNTMGTADTSDDVRYGIQKGAASTGYGGYYVPIAGVNLGLDSSNTTAVSTVRIYDKVGPGEEIKKDTGEKTLKTIYGTTAYNYIDIQTTVKEKEVSAGNSISLNATFTAGRPGSTFFAYCVAFTNYPIIYIRDETGSGITDVKLVNSSGVDILSKYSGIVNVEELAPETTDYNGDGKLARVYRIDTSPLAELPDRDDRYAAAIGYCDISGNGRTLKLTYNVNPLSTYSDSQTAHYIYDAIFLKDNDITTVTNRNNRTQFVDTFDVDGDGATSGIGIISALPSYLPKNYYKVLSRADISVSMAGKTPDASEYTAWDGTESYLCVEPDTDYLIKTGVFNGSGFPTSTEIDKITYIYIPVPVEGQCWGELSKGIDAEGKVSSSFAYTNRLTAAIENPDTDHFVVEYGTVDTSKFTASTNAATVGTAIRNSSTVWKDFYTGANCVRITVSGMPASTDATDFIMHTKIDGTTAETGEVNIFAAAYFENITDDMGRVYMGWLTSDKLALKIVRGSISGRVWRDIDHDGIQDSDEPGIAGAVVTLSDGSTDTTDANGAYSFEELAFGEYTVRCAYAADEYVLSAANAGSDDAADSDAAAGNGAAVIGPIVIPVTDDMYDVTDMDVGLTPLFDVEYHWSGDIPGSAALPAAAKIPSKTVYAAEAVPGVEGYTFDGWYTDEGCTVKYADGTAITADIDFYGKWTVNSYTISFANTGDSVIDPITLSYGTAVPPPADPARTGHTFTGWSPAIPGTMPARDMTVTAQWQINQYTIDFDANGGSEVADITDDYGTTVTPPADPTREGYTFTGWDDDIPENIPAENIKITAQWQINQYTIDFDANGGSEVADITDDYGTTVTPPADPTREGYTFKGWDDEIPDTIPAEDIKITAKWEINQYTIFFADTGDSIIDPITQDYGTDVDPPADPTREGYTFTGWDMDIPETIPAENVTITAQWDINYYNVDYAWGALVPSAAVLPGNDNVPYGTAYNAKAPAACTGYTFDGWFTDKACTAPYTDGTAVSGDITLYGKWTRRMTGIEGSVIWVENGEGYIRPETVTVNLLQNDTVIDSVEIIVSDGDVQDFAFADQPEYSEDGTVKYEYTVEQESAPANYVEAVSGFEIVNTYNVNRYYITVEWDHTGAPADEKVTEATVILYRDGEGYRIAELSEETPTAAATIARLEAEGHTFGIEQNDIPGYETTYGEPVGEDTDGDGTVDAVIYTVKNTYIMPLITVSGDIEWMDVPDGETVPDITVKLMLNGEVIDTVEIPSGNPTYQFTGLDRYNADGTAAEYTVEAEAVPSYSTTYSEPETGETGDITIDITNTGRFAYGSLVVSNTVSGGDDGFTFTITVGTKQEPAAATSRAAAVQYPCSGAYSGTVTAGVPTEFTLKNGESITIEKILVGVSYTVVQDAHPDYYTTPASLSASGVIAEGVNAEPFVNSKIPTGTLSITTKVTGSGADRNTIFEYKVTIDSDESFEYTIGTYSGTLKSGDVLRIKHGETVVISGIKENTAYSVEQAADLGYKVTSTGTSGVITAQGITASFINTKEDKVAGGTSGPDTGDYGRSDSVIIALSVMQLAMLMMLFCIWQMKRRREDA